MPREPRQLEYQPADAVHPMTTVEARELRLDLRRRRHLLDELPEAIGVDVWAVTVLLGVRPRARRFRDGTPATPPVHVPAGHLPRRARRCRARPQGRPFQPDAPGLPPAARRAEPVCSSHAGPTERADTITANAEDQRAAQAVEDTPSDRRRRACPVPPGWHGERRR